MDGRVRASGGDVRWGGARRGRARRAVAVGAVLLFVFALALPAGAQEQDGGSITATVTVADQVCVLVSAEVLDFGVLDFDDSATSAPYAVESCSSGGQERTGA